MQRTLYLFFMTLIFKVFIRKKDLTAVEHQYTKTMAKMYMSHAVKTNWLV